MSRKASQRKRTEAPSPANSQANRVISTSREGTIRRRHNDVAAVLPTHANARTAMPTVTSNTWKRAAIPPRPADLPDQGSISRRPLRRTHE